MGFGGENRMGPREGVKPRGRGGKVRRDLERLRKELVWYNLESESVCFCRCAFVSSACVCDV